MFSLCAGWPKLIRVTARVCVCVCVCGLCSCSDNFFAALQIISALPYTCIEIYEVHGDNYSLKMSNFMPESHSVYTYTADSNSDLTGYYINSSRPISVVAGHPCAFVPEKKFFCDHMVEQIPPVGELGLTHIVPPISGRMADAGYENWQYYCVFISCTFAIR